MIKQIKSFVKVMFDRTHYFETSKLTSSLGQALKTIFLEKGRYVQFRSKQEELPPKGEASPSDDKEELFEKSPNLHIIEYLDYYLGKSFSPEFGVLIKGNWGIGKTWFIKRYLKSRSVEQGSKKHIYITLYGVCDIDQIEDQIFKQLYPGLSSDSMVLAGKIAKGLLKASVRIDLDGEGKSGTSVTPQLPEIKLPKFLTDTKDKVLIFDDLERCEMETPKVLGYINCFVEQQNLKTIILCDESIILGHEESTVDTNSPRHKYTDIKEKLIGQSFQLGLNGVIPLFL